MKRLVTVLCAATLAIPVLTYASKQQTGTKALVRRAMQESDSTYGLLNKRIFAGYEVATRTAMKSANLVERYILTEYVGGGYSVFDTLAGEFSEYSLQGASPFRDLELQDVIYLNSLSYCIRSSDGYYYTPEGRCYSAADLASYAAREVSSTPGTGTFNVEQEIALYSDSSDDSKCVNYLDNVPVGNYYAITNYTYFWNLKNFGFNNDLSCGLVAIEQLLDYFNCIYDSRFVPSQYVVSEDSELDYQPLGIIDYPSSPGSSFYFLGKLESLAYEWQLLDVGMNMSEINTFLDKYLNIYRGFSKSDYTLHSIVGNAWDKLTGNAKKRVTQQIVNGNPVIVGLTVPDSDIGHACVAFGVSSDGYAHIITNYGYQVSNPVMFIPLSRLQSCTGIRYWNASRTHIPTFYTYKGKALDPLVDLKATPNAATHSSYANLNFLYQG